MDLELQGKAALVTGGNRGIGAAIAAELAREGVDLCLVARDKDALASKAAELAAEFKVRIITVAADLRLADAADAAIAEAVKAFGKLDILVNNAGATARGDFFALSEQDWDDGFGLKFRACVRMTRSAWPHLRDAGGSAINVIGVGGWTAESEFTIGGSVNAALLHFTKAMAQIGQQDGVRVNAINPGRIATERLTRNINRIAGMRDIPVGEAAGELLQACHIKRFGEPREIGQVAAFLASGRASFMQGSLVDVDGGEKHSM
ncbi:SDR family oxidoreductase [Oxalobacteraceae bacterium CAVE-383]|nr:SDR family oxidoreductase [Oxalobacteraceae bacterium CAVE-383]